MEVLTPDSQRRGWLGSLMRHYRAELSGTVTRLTRRVTHPAPPGLLIPAAGGAQGHLSGALCTNPGAVALPAHPAFDFGATAFADHCLIAS